MNELILSLLALPALTLLAILLAGQHEARIASTVLWSTRLSGLTLLALLLVWANSGFPAHEVHPGDLYHSRDYPFSFLFYLDEVSAVYLFTVWSIVAIIVKYCRVYLHREAGYQRFFLTLYAFVFGLNLIVLAGSIDLLFAGWEIAGVASFLLIAFYRHRVQPIRNALRAYSIYRFCDLGLLLGAWMSHVLFHESSHFSHLSRLFEHPDWPPAGFGALFLLSLLILTAAAGKSAQFPFCFWLPRAMEGPTPSSAIFYGALSVHLGVFLLLRTQPIWSYHGSTRFIVLLLGLLTVAIAHLAEKTQSNIKGQIAYASITQVGFMFIELALGLEALVLLHFLGNAFLRCYQLLVSPSVVAHLLRVEGAADTGFYIRDTEQFTFLPVSIRHALPEVLQNTLYSLSLQEGGLERLVHALFWMPLKKLGSRINRIGPARQGAVTLAGVLLSAFLIDVFNWPVRYLAVPLSIAMMIASMAAFGEAIHPYRIWNKTAASAFLAALSVWFLNADFLADSLIFLGGIIPSWLLGLWALRRLQRGGDFTLTPFSYHGFAETKPIDALWLLLGFLGLTGFPITPAFLGEELLLSHATGQAMWFALPITAAFVINGIALARLYQRLCLGRPCELEIAPTQTIGDRKLKPAGARAL